jgi:glycosyltransferase involved in cell wall biosynthesis
MQNCLADAKNIWTHFVRIPDGPRLNGVLAACSALFAAYLDFPHSSNILTKAALLEKPVIVSEGSLMAERVRRFRLGELVPQGDVDATAAAIFRITRDPASWIAQNNPDWAGYRSRHSFEALKGAFAEMFSVSNSNG